MDADQQHIHDLLLRLLTSIREGDINTYKELSSTELTCFEPETQNHPVYGLDFHLFLMGHTEAKYDFHIEVVNPTIRVYDNTAYAAYTRIDTVWKEEGPKITSANETRVFHKYESGWKMEHFHRSWVLLLVHRKQMELIAR